MRIKAKTNINDNFETQKKKDDECFKIFRYRQNQNSLMYATFRR